MKRIIFLLLWIWGCGFLAAQNPNYVYFQDSICSGNEYHNHGFDLARQDSMGWHSYSYNCNSSPNCDTVYVLNLLVMGTPTLTTTAQSSEICSGQSVVISASAQNPNTPLGPMPPAVAVGDILCDDNSIVKPSAWPVAGRTAKGIVFHVDATGEHGWATHLQNQGTFAWGRDDVDIPALQNHYNPRDFDMNGFSNTQLIRAAGSATDYPAAYAVDFPNGWYLPAAGQLRLLYAETETVNAS